MARRKRAWSKTIEEAGVSVRLFERGAAIYHDVRNADGGRDKKSLGHNDRPLAEQQARALARRISELRYVGQSSAVSLGQLSALYERDRMPILTDARQRAVRGMLVLLERHFGRGYVLDDLSQHALDGYVRARQKGTLQSTRHRTGKPGVGAGTVRNELHLLGAMTAWGQAYKVNGRRLLAGDPMTGLTLPSEKNARRPIANEARYRALLTFAAIAEPSGRFACVLTLARATGRRIRAICELRRSDVLLTREHMRAALAAFAMDLAHADAWPLGAIRWGSASDKLGFEAITPIGTDARGALELYLREHPSVGDAPLFPASADPSRPIGKEMAGYWLTKAERLAKLEHMDRGGFHAFRRAYASERRHLPAQDVAASAGWRSLKVMTTAYMQADAATVYSVVESKAAVPILPLRAKGRARRAK
jgi:integrase